MIAALIFVISAAALLQFFVSYSRSLIAACQSKELSDQAREIIGMGNRRVCGDEFWRVVQLIRLCPEPGNDSTHLRAVRWYFDLLGLLRRLGRAAAPGVAQWAEFERAGCAHFAAVALDRRIAYSRALMAQQMSNNL